LTLARFSAGIIAEAARANRAVRDKKLDVLLMNSDEGAALQHPSWAGSHIGFEPFPVAAPEEAANETTSFRCHPTPGQR
jgi:hypothetical protein